ncbi:MAG: hypothetical protein QOI93_5218 [Rhodospirillaceae bacterium]|nr:hypothetical protein [Rhodospirillaceae bacterium]
MTSVHVPFETAYRRPYLPRSCKVPRDEYLRVTGVATVRQITREDAALAFRIVSPSKGPRYAMLSPEERTVDILSFAGKIWWPHGEAKFGDQGNWLTAVHHKTSADEWRNDIRTKSDLLKVVPEGDMIVDTESFSRTELPDERGQTIAMVQRILFENFAVCDGSVYAAGGVPVHALWRHARFSQVEVVSSGVDRNVENFGPLYGHPGFIACLETQLAFSEGRFWPPGRLNPAALRRSQRLFPEIQVVAPELIPPNLADRIQIDALYRRTMRDLNWLIFYTCLPGSGYGLHDQNREVKRLFKSRVRHAFQDAAEPSPDHDVTDATRLEALRSLFVGKRVVPKKHLRMIEAIDKSFRDLNRRNPPEELAPADVAALNSLGS